MLKRKATVFLVSDFWADDFSLSLSILGRRHDLVAVRIRDPRETSLPDVGLVRWVDAETGCATINRYLPTTSSTDSLDGHVQRHDGALEKLFASRGVDLVDVDVTRSYVDPLRKFFIAREGRPPQWRSAMNHRFGRCRPLQRLRKATGDLWLLVATGCLGLLLSGLATAQTLTPPAGPRPATPPPGKSQVRPAGDGQARYRSGGADRPGRCLAAPACLRRARYGRLRRSDPRRAGPAGGYTADGGRLPDQHGLLAGAPGPAGRGLLATTGRQARPGDRDQGAGAAGFSCARWGRDSVGRFSWRVYRTQPFRLQVGDYVSAPVTVLGRAEGLGQVAAIRGPRGLGYDLKTLLMGCGDPDRGVAGGLGLVASPSPG